MIRLALLAKPLCGPTWERVVKPSAFEFIMNHREHCEERHPQTLQLVALVKISRDYAHFLVHVVFSECRLFINVEASSLILWLHVFGKLGETFYLNTVFQRSIDVCLRVVWC